MKRASFTIHGADFTPNDEAWRVATTAQKRAYWKKVGEFAILAKRMDLTDGVDVHGMALKPVKMEWRLGVPPAFDTSRLKPGRFKPSPQDGATGPPLLPRGDTSRFSRYLQAVVRNDGVTVFWGQGWGLVVDAHRIGARINPGFGNPRVTIKLPVRDTVGLSPRRAEWVRQRAADYWRNASGVYGRQRDRQQSRLPGQGAGGMSGGSVFTSLNIRQEIERQRQGLQPKTLRTKVIDWLKKATFKLFNR